MFTATYLDRGPDDGCCHGYHSVSMATLTTTICVHSWQILVTLIGMQVVWGISLHLQWYMSVHTLQFVTLYSCVVALRSSWSIGPSMMCAVISTSVIFAPILNTGDRLSPVWSILNLDVDQICMWLITVHTKSDTPYFSQATWSNLIQILTYKTIQH